MTPLGITTRGTSARLKELVGDEWVTPSDLVPHVKVAKSVVQRALVGLAYTGDLERRQAVVNGRKGYQYRRRPPGQKAPLYESPLSAAELSRCFGGYTYVQQPGAIQHGISQ